MLDETQEDRLSISMERSVHFSLRLVVGDNDLADHNSPVFIAIFLFC